MEINSEINNFRNKFGNFFKKNEDAPNLDVNGNHKQFYDGKK